MALGPLAAVSSSGSRTWFHFIRRVRLLVRTNASAFLFYLDIVLNHTSTKNSITAPSTLSEYIDS